MARRRRSFLTSFRSITRNIKTVLTTLAGLGIVGSVGYFSWSGFGDLLTCAAKAPNIVVAIPPKQDDQIKIGSFNIQNFGKSQLENPQVVATLAHIAMGFDVVAIQEISHKHGDALGQLIAKMNEEQAGRFEYLISPLLGKEGGKDTEQFGFVYDTHRIELGDSQHGFVVSEKKFRRKFDRLPVVSSFTVKKNLSDDPFTFSLVTFHNVPNGNPRYREEVANIKDIYQEVRTILSGEDDIILLGDFNAGYEKITGSLGPLKRNFTTALTTEMTNVKQTHSYDNLVFDASTTTEFIQGQVLDFTDICAEYGAAPEDVSDHFPVFGFFGVDENQPVTKVASK